MKSASGVAGTANKPGFFLFLQAAIPFFATLIAGALLSAVVALFVYANASDVHSRDGQFLAVVGPGAIMSFIVAFFVARRSLRAEQDQAGASGHVLLNKYRHGAHNQGADAQAGQYNIGEQYLRDLLGRRGA